VHPAANSYDNSKAVRNIAQLALQLHCVRSSIVNFGHSLLQSGRNNKWISMPNGCASEHLKPAKIRSLTAQLAT